MPQGRGMQSRWTGLWSTPWYLTCLWFVGTGCSTAPFVKREPQEQLAPVISSRDFETVDDLAKPLEFHPLELKGVGLAVRLDGTGGDPPDSPERRYLLEEMQKRRVQQASKYLGSANCSLVLVRGIVPAGAQEGDRFDLEITLPPKTPTTDLQGGWVLPTYLKESAVLNGRFTYGHTLAQGGGSILTDAMVDTETDAALRRRGRILGGGRLQRTRDLGLRLREEHYSARTSDAIAKAINERFSV
ncbi:MAG TPA: flagellar basal body P-ring protein FlgI, partial [Pirellulaceae bacterium]